MYRKGSPERFCSGSPSAPASSQDGLGQEHYAQGAWSWYFALMATANPLLLDPVLEALARAPIGEEDMTAEQQAEFAAIVAEYEGGRARLVPHEDVPAALEAIARARSA